MGWDVNFLIHRTKLTISCWKYVGRCCVKKKWTLHAADCSPCWGELFMMMFMDFFFFYKCFDWNRIGFIIKHFDERGWKLKVKMNMWNVWQEIRVVSRRRKLEECRKVVGNMGESYCINKNVKLIEAK